MSDPILKYVFQPFVNLTGVDPKAAGMLAANVAFPLALYDAWLDWTRDHDLFLIVVSAILISMFRMLYPILARVGPRIRFSRVGHSHAMIRAYLLVQVLSSVLFTCVWLPQDTLHDHVISVVGGLVYVAYACCFYLPLCDRPPPRRKKDPARKLAHAWG